jgi:hypothetical protein
MTRPGEIKRNGRPRKWKRCPECGKTKSLAEDFYHWKETRGRPRESRVCKECTRARNRARYARIMADPYLAERERAMNAERHRRTAEANRERCRRYRAKVKAERPEVYQRQLEDARIRTRLQHNNAAELPKWTVSSFAEPATEAPQHLPVEPLAAFVRIARAEGAKVSQRDVDIVTKAVNHGYRVGLPVADRIITCAGGALSNVYPEVYS